ncbi:MAG: UbiA family prenyltransferase [Ignavibacteria bacterium]|nr:UbiA family prenyltransferase [Ignavibacteria bacterium]
MNESNKKLPICVDLDYTVINSDILIESILLFIKQNPLHIFLLFFWFLKGKTYLKRQLHRKVKIDIANLPYNENILNFLRKKKKEGHKLILVTASLQEIADEINKNLQLFDEVFGTQNSYNLKSKNKALFLKDKFGLKGFDYLGDSIFDLPVWKIANKAFVTSDFKFVIKKVSKLKNFAENLGQVATFKDFIKSIRIHQWIKNILIFAPLLLAHRFDDTLLFVQCLIAFVSFSLVASSCYIINDIFDIANDRIHPQKKNRPIASGKISVYKAMFYSFSILSLGLFLSSWVNFNFFLLLLFYSFINLTYTNYFKYIFIIDFFTLASLYVVRIYAGSIASSVEVSNWLLAFSMFFFISLAVLKRYSDLIQNENNSNLTGRPYNVQSSIMLLTIGLSSVFASTIILILYINTQKVLQFYKSPNFLWLDAFLVLLWSLLLWNDANQRKIAYDPVTYALKDPKTLFIACLIIAIWILAIIV